MIQAKVIADSISAEGKRLTTLQLTYPRFVHAEFLTHRVFSRNASSSRAIPVAKMIEQVRNDPAMPVHWGKNQPGMQAHEQLVGVELDTAKTLWIEAAESAAEIVEHMMGLGLHKQVANRILEPFQWIHVVLTATEFDNWDELRHHADADPNIYELARVIKIARNESTPKLLQPGEWHLPYVTDDDTAQIARHLIDQGNCTLEAWDLDRQTELLRKVSAARCCRVSYLKHDGHPSTVQEDLALCDRLAGARPIHASPFEHQAAPDVLVPGARGQMSRWNRPELHGNFVGWIQHRKLIEQSFK
jgi:thymidylate synthase ThyX